MALDLANGYLRYDSASASNLYYGYNINPNATDSDTTWLIRRVNTSGGVQSTKWANGNMMAYTSNWNNRVSYFTAPSGNLSFTYSKSGRSVGLGWTALSGVDNYVISSTDINGNILDRYGNIIPNSQYSSPICTDVVKNSTVYSLNYASSGTYSVTLTAINVSGTTSSTYTFGI
jgi:hypothetical protein